MLVWAEYVMEQPNSTNFLILDSAGAKMQNGEFLSWRFDFHCSFTRTKHVFASFWPTQLSIFC